MTEALGTTPSATVGPYLSIGLTWDDGADVVSGHSDAGITISGTVYDGNGDVVPDGLIEIWQADPDGRFNHPDDPRGPRSFPSFRGFGRCATDRRGRYEFRTLKPGPLPAEAGQLEAPHINVSVFARGLLSRLVTRLYFPDETQANGADPVLATLTESERVLLTATATGPRQLRFDVHLQGESETPFFSV
jgi:protocatechuate 3,4-dioxygenase, alpha subunit